MDVEDELRDLLEERDNYINELEAELETQEDGSNKLGKDLIQCQDKIAELQVQVKQLRLDNDDLIGENTQLDEQAKAHRSQLDAQKGILAIASKSSQEAKRQQKDGNQQLHRLELENQRLRATVLEVEENEDILVNEIDTLVKEKSEFQEQSEELSSKCDALYADLDEKARANSKLLEEKEKAQSDLEAEHTVYAKEIDVLERKDAASRSEITRLLLELEQERAKHKESAHIKENEAFRAELREIRKVNQKLHSLYDKCLLDKNQAERDLDHTIQALNESKRNAKDQIASAARKERVALAESNAKLDRSTAKLDSALQKCNDTDEQLEDLRKQLDQSEARNSSYEKSHGLTEAIRHQKQLDADIRRRDYDLKRKNHALGNEIEKRRSLTKACDWLKEKANVGPDFKFDDSEIRIALQREDNVLQFENLELSRQIECLEGERTKLLSQLRERAVDIGEKGIRFLGMSSNQVAQVMEFASNIRNGIAELPLNDRSKELLSEISSLKSHREVDRVTIERLGREIFSLSEEHPHSEGLILKQTLDSMTADNQKLREEIDALKEASSSNPNGSALTPLMRDRVKELLGEDLVQMPANAELQFVLIMNQCDKATQELASLTIKMTERGIKEHSINSMVADGHSHEGEGERVGNYQANDSKYTSFGDTERNKKLTNIMPSMERAMRNLRNERDVLSSQLSQYVEGRQVTMVAEITKLATRCKTLEEDLQIETQARIIAQRDLVDTRATKKRTLNAAESIERQQASLGCNVKMSSTGEMNVILTKAGLSNASNVSQKETEECAKLNFFNGTDEHNDAHTQMDRINESLQQTRNKLSGYMKDMAHLRGTIFAMQENRIDSAKFALQISCLNDIIGEKNRIIQGGKKKLANAKQISLRFSRDPVTKSDRSLSTSSIDRSIIRAATNPGQNSPTRNCMQTSLKEATRLVFEKETVIEDKCQTILELEQKLAYTEQSYQQVAKEAESMKTDISTLVSKLSEAEAAVNGIEAYQQKLDEAQDLTNENKKKSTALKSKCLSMAKENQENDAKIKELQETLSRTKRMMMVTRQGRARSEQNLKAANEEVTALKDQLEKMGSQMNALKKDKVDAQNTKLKLSQKARISATKLKDMAEECQRKESSKTVEELEKRVNVLNKTVSGLASQNSKLRGELAAYKLSLKKKNNEETSATQMMTPPMAQRGSVVSREQPSSSRSKTLEGQVKALQKSLSQESQRATDKSSMLDRYHKKIHALEQALQSASERSDTGEVKNSALNRSELLQQQVLSLTNENKCLKRRVDNVKSDGNDEARVKQLVSENKVLKKENERLSQIDHLDFFEEIEDLKYKYNEAVRQINQLTTGL